MIQLHFYLRPYIFYINRAFESMKIGNNALLHVYEFIFLNNLGYY